MVQDIYKLDRFGALDDLIEVLVSNYGSNKVTFITGKASFASLGGAKIIEQAKNQFDVLQLANFSPNPKIEDLTRLSQEVKRFHPDVLVAIGGGSVIDMSKLLKAVLNEPQANIIDIVRGKRTIQDCGVPLIAVPTTAGSGSEATHFAVCYEGRDKYSVASDFLSPDKVFLDGRTLADLPLDIRRASALDAFAQAIESYWAVGATDASRSASVEALNILRPNIVEYCRGSGAPNILQAMMKGSHLAGMAINVSKTTSAHAWSYGFTSSFNIPHGDAVWITLPKIFQLHEAVGAKSDQQLFKRIEELRELIGIPLSVKAQDFFDDFLGQLGLETSFDKIGLGDRSVRKELSISVNMQRMENNPMKFSQENIDQIFGL